MNKKFTKLIAAIALLVFMAPSMVGWGQTRAEVTWTASQQNYSNGQSLDGVSIELDDYITIQFDKNDGNTAPAYYNTGTAARLYPKNSLTVTPTSGYQITGMTLTFSGTGNTGTLGASVGSYSLSSATGTWSGSSTSAVVLTNNATSGHARMQVLTVTYSETGSNPPTPTTYTVTYDCNGGTIGCPSNLTGVEAGTTITLADAPTKDGFDFDGWSDGTTTYDAGDEYTVNGDVTFAAQWTAQSTGGDDHWVLTELSDLTTSDVFVIVGNNGSNYAMKNTDASNSGPAAIAVTVSGTELTGIVPDNIKWNISGNATDGYIFSPNGSTTTWLYCINNNNGLRIGSGNTDYNTFEIKASYIYNKGRGRYVGVYTASGQSIAQDWRSYTSSGGNIANQTFAFYKKVTGGVVPPTITAANVDITYDATNGNIAYTINNGIEGGSVSATTTSEWLTLGEDFTSPIAFTCTVNEANTARTATVTLTYTYGDNETVTKDVTVTQAAAPLIYTTIPDIFDAATSTSTNVNVTFGNWVVSGVNGSNAFVTDNSGNGFIIYTSDHGFVVNDKLSGTVMGTPLKLYKGSAEFTNLSSTTDGLTVSNDGSITVITDKTIANLGGVNTGAVITLSNLTYDGTNLSDGTNTIKPYNTLYSGMSFTSGKIYNVTGVYQQYDNTKEILPRSADDIEEVVSAEPSVTVTPNTIDAPFAGADGTLAITYENIPDLISFDYYFCDANGTELEETDPNYPDDWIYAEINDENDVYSLGYLIDANDGEARTAYIKVYTTDVPGNEEVYAIVTVNQAEYVIDYATLPFEWAGGLPTDFDALNGTTLNSVGSYPNQTTYQMKLDEDDDYIQVKCDQQPGIVTIGVKMVGGNSTSYITVQGSADGETFTNVETLTISGAQNSTSTLVTTNAFASTDRYVRLLFTKGSNVGVGPISIAAYEAPVPAITVESTTITAPYEGTSGTLNVTYTAIEMVDIYWFESDGTTDAFEPEWMAVDFDNDWNVDYEIGTNEGIARTAYFKVYGVDGEGNDVYSDLVTVSQAAAPQDYDLTVEPFENLEIITFVNDEMEMEEDGTIQVTAGAQVMLSIVADEGYVMETLMVNGVDHVNDIAGDFTYTFEMPAEAVTISATAVEQVAPVGGDYVRITSLNQLTDGSIVVIAARYDEEHTNGYYAMRNATSGKPTGVLFTSTTSGDNEILPASIVDNEDDYYWVVNETENGFTFTNFEGFMIGYNSSTNFATGGSNTEWTIDCYTASSTSMVPNHAGFKIVNFNQNGRAFALNESHNYGPYATSNMNGTDAYKYNFCLDFFVQSEASVTETYTLEIDAYDTDNKQGWYLIASPLAGEVNLSDVAGLTNETFRLYRFNQSAESEWQYYNGTNNSFTTLANGKGYLYANTTGDDLTFTGVPYSGDGAVSVVFDGDAEFAGWNLIGNPFGTDAYLVDDENQGLAYIRMNSDGNGFDEVANNAAIAPMEGIFYQATAAGTVYFSTTAPGAKSGNLNMTVSQGRGTKDNAIIRFGEGNIMEKFSFREGSTKVYIPQDGKDYAVVNAESQGEMPVSFKAEENGTYSLSFNAEEVTFSYLHLIDNMTGTDIDLLAAPSYTFEARTTDYESRFKLVFATGSNSDDDSFAFFSNGQLIVSNDGKATLQVIDLTGRILSSETINGSCSKTFNVPAGVYMLRLVNGDVRVQKVVVR